MRFARRVCAVVVGVTLVIAPSLGRAGTAVLASSTFDTDADGWGVRESDIMHGCAVAFVSDAVDHYPTGGNPGGYISHLDRGGWVFYFSAPLKFLGDKEVAYEGCLSFDRKLDIPFDEDIIHDVVLIGAGKTIVFDLPPPSGTTWTSQRVCLNVAAGWTYCDGASVDEADMRLVLGSLDMLLIQGDMVGGPYRGSLDNVILDASGCPGEVYPKPMTVVCPADIFIPAYSTIPWETLIGFGITNEDTLPVAFNYFVYSSGPLVLNDNGNPAAVSGTTPILAPGATHYPPDASLRIPEIRWAVFYGAVVYRVSAVGDDACQPTFCSTSVIIEPPVSVFIQSFAARALHSGVELMWDVASDEEIKGFNIYRIAQDKEVHKLINSDGLIPAEERKYIDKSALSSQTYQYTLSVVREDNSEVQSQEVRVQTRAHVLALHQNHPNPFNPSTTISFTLPKRSLTKLEIYNIEGKLVTTLVDGTLDEGFKQINWDATDSYGNPVSSGVYFYHLKAGGKVLTKKMVLLK
jgi:hypothetical protein